MLRTCVAVGALAAMLGTVGCADSVEFESMQSRVISSDSSDAVLAEGVLILRREFGRATLNSETGLVKTQTVEFVTEHESGSARDLYGGRSQMRRSATMSVGKRGDTVVARVRVDIERKNIAQVSGVGHSSNPLNDSPGAETPMNRDAGTTEKQNTVWTQVRRDFAMERAILDELKERFARLSAESEAPGAATTAPAGPGR